MSNNQSRPTERMVWVDCIRFLAIFMVICVHCSDPFNVSAEARMNPDYNFWGGLYGALLRPCVPLFVMLTGLLILPVHQNLGFFYKKRVLRIIVPFLIWSVLYNLFPWITGIVGLNMNILSDMFAYAGELPSQSFSDSLNCILMIPFHFSVYTIPLWYIYMLIGLYLYMPFFSAWIEKATDRQIKIYLLIWLVSLFLPYAYELISTSILGACAWNDFGTFYYFAGFNGYLLLGYYLKKRHEWPMLRTILFSVIAFTVGYVVTYIGFRHMTAQPSVTERQMELFFMYCSPNVMLMTVAVFLIVQKIRLKSSWLVSALSDIAKCGLGIYMIHYFIVGVGYLVVDKIGIPIPLRIPVTALLVFAGAWFLVSLFYRLAPKCAKWVMG